MILWLKRANVVYSHSIASRHEIVQYITGQWKDESLSFKVERYEVTRQQGVTTFTYIYQALTPKNLTYTHTPQDR